MRKIKIFMISAIACGNFVKIAMTSLERTQKILVGSLESLIHFFAWLCRQYEDLPTVIQTNANLSCVYATRTLFHLMKEVKDPLYEQILDKDYKFPSMEQLSQVIF